MWNRARLLAAAELASAGAFVAGASLAVYGICGIIGGVACSLILSGGFGFYLANSYSIGGLSDQHPPSDRT